MSKTPNEIAGAIGRGLLAGFAGTAAITLIMLFETCVAGPDQSAETERVPAEAVSKVTGVAVKGKKQKKQMSQAVHWGYGTGWGTFRAFLGVRGFKATILHFLAISAAASVMLPALHVAPPPNKTPLKKSPRKASITLYTPPLWALSTMRCHKNQNDGNIPSLL